MSIMDCLIPRLPAGMLKEIQGQYDVFLKTALNDTLKADNMLLEWLPVYRDQAVRARVQSALAAVRVEERIQRILGGMETTWKDMNSKSKKWDSLVKGRSEPTRANAIERLYATADLEARQGANELLGELSGIYKKMAPKGIMLDADRKLMSDVLDGLVDGVDTVADPMVRSLAGELRTVLTKAIDSYKNAGGLVGTIKNYVPIKHNAAKIRGVGFNEWYNAYREMTDISKVVDYKTGKFVSEERFQAIAEDMYNDIITDGAARAARELDRSRKSMRFNNPDMFSRRMQARLSAPKNAAAFKRYNEMFGVGDDGMFDLIMSNLEGIGRDTGVMRAMGPTPYNLNSQMIKMIKAEGGNTADIRRTEALFRTLVGHWEGSIDGMLGKVASGLHNLLSSSLLGTASVAALGDNAFAAHAVRMNGMINARGGMAQYFESIVGDTDAVLKALHVAEALSHASVSRFDGAAAVSPTGRLMTGLNNLKNLNHRVSGLQKLTLATGDNISVSFFSEMGELAKKKTGWGDLHKDFRAALERADIFPDEWQRIVDYGPDDRGFVSPDWLPDDMSLTARKLSVLNLELRNLATNSPDLRQRMWSTGNRMGAQAQGDIANVASSLIFQFKSFPMVVWRNHFVPSATRAINGDVTPMGLMLAQGMFYGAVIVQAKELLNGKDMMAWDDPAFWAKAAWQSGFAGLFGDSLFKDPEAYGRSFVTEFAGPGAAVTANIAQKSLGGLKQAFLEGDDSNVNWAAITAAYKPLIPLSTLWYFKTGFDRTVMDTLNAMDPDFYDNAASTNAKLTEERGSAGWWKKGSTMPEVMK